MTRLNFVWSDPVPLYSGRGGTESYTIGHVRELLKRGIDARIITFGHGKNDGRQFHPGIPFYDIQSIDELSSVDGPIIFINIPHAVPTKQPAFVMFHFPPLKEHGSREEFIAWSKGKRLLTNSYFLRDQLVDFLRVKPSDFTVDHPFADPTFSEVERPPSTTDKVRVLFAGRLHPEKGIYTFLESLHHCELATGFEFTVTTAGNQTSEGKIIEKLLRAHPAITVVPARHKRCDMAKLLAEQDIVVMPSNHQYWHEGFGMISVESQHAGCRVIASNDGGLPETDCGALTLVEPGHSLELAKAICAAAKAGPVSAAARKKAGTHFTRAASVDTLLSTIRATQ